MTIDRFTKASLCLIIILLVCNLAQKGSMNIVPKAQAQSGNSTQVTTLNGFSVSGLQQIVSLGDGKSFVAYTNDKFMVYQLK